MLGKPSQFTQEVRQSCQLVKSSSTLSFYLPLGQGHGARTESPHSGIPSPHSLFGIYSLHSQRQVAECRHQSGR